MFIRFNYRCLSCGHEEERFLKKDEMDDQFCHQPECEWVGFMTRLPAAPKTHFRFNDKKLKG